MLIFTNQDWDMCLSFSDMLKMMLGNLLGSYCTKYSDLFTTFDCRLRMKYVYIVGYNEIDTLLLSMYKLCGSRFVSRASFWWMEISVTHGEANNGKNCELEDPTSTTYRHITAGPIPPWKPSTLIWVEWCQDSLDHSWWLNHHTVLYCITV